MSYAISHVILTIFVIVTHRGNDAIITISRILALSSDISCEFLLLGGERPRGKKDTARSTHHVDT
jgi:hypothetical protein